MDHVLFDNGQKGIVSRFGDLDKKIDSFIAVIRERDRAKEEKERVKKEDDDNKDKRILRWVAIIGVPIGVLTLVILAGTLWVAYLSYINAKRSGLISDSPTMYSQESPLGAKQ